MNPSEFRALLARARLTQRELASLAEISPTALNRYCSETAADRVPVPRVVVALVLSYVLLSERQQATLRAKLAQLKGQETVAIYDFGRSWAMRAPNGGIGGWTPDVALAGRWLREDAPEEFGAVHVDDPYWPPVEGVDPVWPAAPPRPRPPPPKRRRQRRGVTPDGRRDDG